MALFALLGVLRGFAAAAYKCTPHRKPLCGLDQDKNYSFFELDTHYVHFKTHGWILIKYSGRIYRMIRIKNLVNPVNPVNPVKKLFHGGRL